MEIGKSIGRKLNSIGYKIVYRPVDDVIWDMVNHEVCWMVERITWDTFKMLEEWK